MFLHRLRRSLNQNSAPPRHHKREMLLSLYGKLGSATAATCVHRGVMFVIRRLICSTLEIILKGYIYCISRILLHFIIFHSITDIACL
jgi:hypothetical protein